MGNLESKLEGSPDWKYWLPVYGLYCVCKYGIDKRPTFVNDAFSVIGLLYTAYQ